MKIVPGNTPEITNETFAIHLHYFCITFALTGALTFALHVHYICTTSALHLHYFCTTCALLVHYLCTTFALLMHYLCTTLIPDRIPRTLRPPRDSARAPGNTKEPRGIMIVMNQDSSGGPTGIGNRAREYTRDYKCNICITFAILLHYLCTNLCINFCITFAVHLHYICIAFT